MAAFTKYCLNQSGFSGDPRLHGDDGKDGLNLRMKMAQRAPLIRKKPTRLSGLFSVNRSLAVCYSHLGVLSGRRRR